MDKKHLFIVLLNSSLTSHSSEVYNMHVDYLTDNFKIEGLVKVYLGDEFRLKHCQNLQILFNLQEDA